MRCIVELFGDDRNGRKLIAWGRRIGCGDAGHGFDPVSRKVFTRLAVDDDNPSQHSYLLELVDNPTGVHAIDPMGDDDKAKSEGTIKAMQGFLDCYDGSKLKV